MRPFRNLIMFLSSLMMVMSFIVSRKMTEDQAEYPKSSKETVRPLDVEAGDPDSSNMLREVSIIRFVGNGSPRRSNRSVFYDIFERTPAPHSHLGETITVTTQETTTTAEPTVPEAKEVVDVSPQQQQPVESTVIIPDVLLLNTATSSTDGSSQIPLPESQPQEEVSQVNNDQQYTLATINSFRRSFLPFNINWEIIIACRVYIRRYIFSSDVIYVVLIFTLIFFIVEDVLAYYDID